MADQHGWTVIVPVKSLSAAKSRLEVSEPGALALAFLLDVLDAAGRAPAVCEILVASSDPDVRQAAENVRARVIDDSRCTGIDAAASHASRSRTGRGPIAVMVADLPCLTDTALHIALDLASAHATAILADLAGEGTAMWMGAPGHPVRTRFGPQSRMAHVADGAIDLVAHHPEAAADLLPARCDVDTQADLARAVEVGVGPHTLQALTARRQPERTAMRAPM